MANEKKKYGIICIVQVPVQYGIKKERCGLGHQFGRAHNNPGRATPKAWSHHRHGVALPREAGESAVRGARAEHAAAGALLHRPRPRRHRSGVRRERASVDAGSGGGQRGLSSIHGGTCRLTPRSACAWTYRRRVRSELYAAAVDSRRVRGSLSFSPLLPLTSASKMGAHQNFFRTKVGHIFPDPVTIFSRRSSPHCMSRSLSFCQSASPSVCLCISRLRRSPLVPPCRTQDGTRSPPSSKNI